MQEWADALVKGDQAAIDRITSADWMLTDPQGMLRSKAQSDAHRKSGAVKFESFKLDELKVRVYGAKAVVHGLATRRTVASPSVLAPCSITSPSGNQTNVPGPNVPAWVTSFPSNTYIPWPQG